MFIVESSDLNLIQYIDKFIQFPTCLLYCSSLSISKLIFKSFLLRFGYKMVSKLKGEINEFTGTVIN